MTASLTRAHTQETISEIFR